MKEVKEVKCATCGNIYLQRNEHWTRFCSNKCKSKWHRYLVKNKTKIEESERNVICEICGKNFTAITKIQKYCSFDCRNSAIKNQYLQSRKISAFRIFERDDFTCIYCGKSSTKDKVELVVDHIYPRKKGGDNDLMNLITSCSVCNTSKHEMLLKEFIILDLWQRNKKLNDRINVKEYREMVEYFNKHFNLINDPILTFKIKISE